MKLTKKQAKELSIKKWEYIVKNDGSNKGLSDKYPELKNLIAECGYCEKYYHNSCKGCPINLGLNTINEFACRDRSHPFEKWQNNKTKANAQKVLDLIRES